MGQYCRRRLRPLKTEYICQEKQQWPLAPVRSTGCFVLRAVSAEELTGSAHPTLGVQPRHKETPDGAAELRGASSSVADTKSLILSTRAASVRKQAL